MIDEVDIKDYNLKSLKKNTLRGELIEKEKNNLRVNYNSFYSIIYYIF